MESNISGIIEKLKKEGVEKAEQEASEIIEQARVKAENLEKEAREKAKDIVEKASKEAEKIKNNGEAALRQASRDVLLGLKSSILELFDRVVKKQTAKVLDGETVKQAVIKLIEKFTPGEENKVEIILSDRDKQALEETLFSSLKKEMSEGVTLTVSEQAGKGFRIGEKDGSVYYDFTDEAVSEALNLYLNRKLLDILSGGGKDER